MVRIAGVRGVERRHHVHRIHALPGRGIAVAHRLEGEAAGDVDQPVEPAEMRGRLVDRSGRMHGVGEVDATEFDTIGRRRKLRGGVIDAGDARAAREGLRGDHFAKRAEGAGDDDGFSVHGGLREAQQAATHYDQADFICNAGPISPPTYAAFVSWRQPARMFEMPDTEVDAKPISRDRTVEFQLPELPCLGRRIDGGGPIKIVAMGSSSTAGRADVLPLSPLAGDVSAERSGDPSAMRVDRRRQSRTGRTGGRPEEFASPSGGCFRAGADVGDLAGRHQRGVSPTGTTISMTLQANDRGRDSNRAAGRADQDGRRW